MNATFDQLRAQGHPVLQDNIVRLSPLTRKHLNVLSRYNFLLPELPGGLRPLWDSDSVGEDDEGGPTRDPTSPDADHCSDPFHARLPQKKRGNPDNPVRQACSHGSTRCGPTAR